MRYENKAMLQKLYQTESAQEKFQLELHEKGKKIAKFKVEIKNLRTELHVAKEIPVSDVEIKHIKKISKYEVEMKSLRKSLTRNEHVTEELENE